MHPKPNVFYAKYTTYEHGSIYEEQDGMFSNLEAAMKFLVGVVVQEFQRREWLEDNEKLSEDEIKESFEKSINVNQETGCMFMNFNLRELSSTTNVREMKVLD
jgi:hypothetical protein